MMDRIKDLIKPGEYTLAVYYKPLYDPAEILSLNVDTRMPSASIIKIMIMVEAFYQMEEGKRKEDEVISISEKDCVNFSLVSEMLQKEFLFRDLLHFMMVLSDNTATNVVIDLLGMDQINNRARELGLQKTLLQRKMMDTQAAKRGLENQTTVREAAFLIEKIGRGEMISEKASQSMLGILECQKDREMIGRYFPEDEVIAHKTGQIEEIHHDVGIIEKNGEPMILGVFTQGVKVPHEGRIIIGEIARRLIMEDDVMDWGKGIITSRTAPINLHPQATSEMADEGIFGMVVDVKKKVNHEWYFIETDYDYKGYVHESHLLCRKEEVDAWEKEANHLITSRLADVLTGPKYQTSCLKTLCRGARISLTGKEEKDWSEVKLPNGMKGWVRKAFLMEKPKSIQDARKQEEALRNRVVETALSFQDTQYRWGGRTPLGIDCSGLTSISYWLNGIKIYRDAIVKNEYAREITLEEIQKGDLIYFPGHIAMYIGDGVYIHSRASANGVTFNSLKEEDDHYDHELKKAITAVATIF